MKFGKCAKLTLFSYLVTYMVYGKPRTNLALNRARTKLLACRDKTRPMPAMQESTSSYIAVSFFFSAIGTTESRLSLLPYACELKVKLKRYGETLTRYLVLAATTARLIHPHIDSPPIPTPTIVLPFFEIQKFKFAIAF